MLRRLDSHRNAILIRVSSFSRTFVLPLCLLVKVLERSPFGRMLRITGAYAIGPEVDDRVCGIARDVTQQAAGD